MSISSNHPSAGYYAQQVIMAIEYNWGAEPVVTQLGWLVRDLGGNPDLLREMTPHTMMTYLFALVVRASS